MGMLKQKALQNKAFNELDTSCTIINEELQAN